MKNLALGILISLISYCPQLAEKALAGVFDELKSLYNKKEYFKLYTRLQNEKSTLELWQQIYFDAVLGSVFNDPRESNSSIDSLLLKYSSALNDSIKFELNKIRLINHVSLFEYEAAMISSEYVLSNFSSLMGANEKKEMENALVIWKAALSLRSQTVIIKSDSRIKVRKDIAGSINIPLKVNGIKEEFIFDTGANISTVSESNAQKLKLKFLEGRIKVGTVTDKMIDAQLAYAEVLEIGNMVVKNVLFIVLADELLSFAGGLYVIEGILGYPVIKEMKEIQLSEEEIFVPLIPGKGRSMNLALEGFTPVVNVVHKNDTLVFTLDSGARTTILYYSFFVKYKKDISAKYELEELELEGAGGKVKYKGYNLDEIILTVAGSKAKLSDVRLLAQLIKDKETDNYFCGNLGQDFIGQFGKMVVNFENMYVEFLK